MVQCMLSCATIYPSMRERSLCQGKHDVANYIGRYNFAGPRWANPTSSAGRISPNGDMQWQYERYTHSPLDVAHLYWFDSWLTNEPARSIPSSPNISQWEMSVDFYVLVALFQVPLARLFNAANVVNELSRATETMMGAMGNAFVLYV